MSGLFSIRMNNMSKEDIKSLAEVVDGALGKLKGALDGYLNDHEGEADAEEMLDELEEAQTSIATIIEWAGGEEEGEEGEEDQETE